MVAELVGVARGEAFAVNVHEGFRSEPAVRAVTHKASIPFLKSTKYALLRTGVGGGADVVTLFTLKRATKEKNVSFKNFQPLSSLFSVFSNLSR